MDRKRRIAVIIGSDSDLPQCAAGLMLLGNAEVAGLADVVAVHTCSAHRNTDELLCLVHYLASRTDVLIVGAGWANALTGLVDAYLRNKLRTTVPVVIGVPFRDPHNEVHTQAAIYGITEVPGSQVIYGGYSGTKAFEHACFISINNVGFKPIVLPDPKPTKKRSLEEAILKAVEIIKAKEGDNGSK